MIDDQACLSQKNARGQARNKAVIVAMTIVIPAIASIIFPPSSFFNTNNVARHGT